MTTLNDQLPAIDRLRVERDGLSQQMYALRMQISRGRAALKKSEQAGDKTGAPDAAEVAKKRGEIATMESVLRTLSAEEQAARAAIAKPDAARQRVTFLQQSLTGLQSTLDQLETRIALAQTARPKDHILADELQASLDRTRSAIADTTESLAAAQSDQEAAEQAAAAAQAQLRTIVKQSGDTRKAIDDKQAEIGALKGARGPSPGAIRERLDTLNAQFTKTKGTWKAATASLHERIAGIYVEPHPRATVAQMSDATPFLLLPVRIETRFVAQPPPPAQPPVGLPVGKADANIRRGAAFDDSGAAPRATSAPTAAAAAPSPELWLRIYPDDIAVHTHENELTDREVSAGTDYWLAIFAIEKDGNGDKSSRKSETWKNFAALFGPSRSAWVARQTRPTNWSSLATLAAADDLTFPPQDLTKTSAWSRAPRTNVLPDRFVVMLYTGDTIVKEVEGNLIPDELILGPEPLDMTTDADQADLDASFVTVDGQLTFGPAYDWTSNFDRAVSVGMGFRIPITAAQLQAGFDKILVLGVLASRSPASAQTAVETLLNNHQHSPKGLTLLSQGTATNNTDGDGSGYSINDALSHTAEVTGLDVPLFSPESTSDGKRLADGLGISYETLQFVYNSDNTDYDDAVAMNTVLYPATLGYYFDTLLDPLVGETGRDALRDFFVANVTGRGPLSAIRIGDQPYGLLLTSDFSRWKETSVAGRTDSFRANLFKLLQYFDAIWAAMIPDLAFAGKAGLATDEMLLNVLGLQPGSVTFAQRIAYTLEYLANLVSFEAGGAEGDRLIEAGLRSVNVSNLLRSWAGLPNAAGLEANQYELTKLVFQTFTTALDAANIVDAVPLSETSLIREYDPVAHKNYLDWLRDAQTINVLSSQSFGGAPVPTALLYLEARHALILQLHNSAVRWMRGNGVDASVTTRASTFHNVRPSGDLTRWEVLRAPVGAIDAANPYKSLAVADYLLMPGAPVAETQFLNAMRDALDTLSNRSTARLERCFTEHVDVCTYRLDAWQTALFKGRLEALRGLPVSRDGGRRTGSYLGAFGWVENVRPSTSFIAVKDVPSKLKSPTGRPLREYADNGGFIHAPSITHATAAAVLRAGYMSHATPSNPDVMAVNLTSERVRRALFILEGMRNGQAIEALLGYQFERGIHDRASADASLQVLNGLIFDIRTAFPIQRMLIANGDAGGAQETVDTYDVVNGLTLAQTAAPNWASITGADSTVLTPARVAALNAERDRVADTLDAVNDLLLAESTYQMVQSNVDRTAAVLGSIKDATIPPELSVVTTPRSTRFTFTNRVTLHFPRLDPSDPAAATWAAPMTPRASLEPGINQWFGSILGDPADILMRVSRRQDDETLTNQATLSLGSLGLQPIDIVSIIGADASTGDGSRTGASELELRVAWRYRADQGLDETARVQIDFAAPTADPAKYNMGEIMPLMLALQRVMQDSRALDARDYHPSTTQGGTPASGWQFAEVRARAVALQKQVHDVVTAIRALPLVATIGSVNVASLGQASDELRSQHVDLVDVGFTFASSDMLLLQEQLTRLAAFGVSDAFPRVQDATRDASKLALVNQAVDALGAAASRRSVSDKALSDADAAAPTSNDRAVGLACDACKAIVGDAFPVLPAFALDNDSDVMQSHADHAQLVSHAVGALGIPLPEDEWARGMAYVRPRMAAWNRIRLLSETLFDTSLDLVAAQLPYRAQDSWLAVGVPDIDPATGDSFDINTDTLSIVTHGDAAYSAGSLRSGVLIDSWTETIPAKNQSTGIAFNYNRPNAVPPQALLLAVPPEITGHWSWDALVGILNDTLRRAKMRAVEPLLLDKRAANPELGVLLPAVISEFQQYALNVSLDLRLNLAAMPMLASYYLNPNLT